MNCTLYVIKLCKLLVFELLFVHVKFSFPGKNDIATNYVDEQKGKSFIIKTQCFDITLIDCSKNKNEKRCVMHCAFSLLNSVEDYQTADVYMQD